MHTTRCTLPSGQFRAGTVFFIANAATDIDPRRRRLYSKRREHNLESYSAIEPNNRVFEVFVGKSLLRLLISHWFHF